METLARDLGVSKGSFYWHFRDRADLLEAILLQWEKSTADMIRTAETESAGSERLRRLFEEITQSSVHRHRAVHALHSWAAKDPSVAARVNRVEQERIGYLHGLFQQCGLSPAEAAWRAQIVHLIYLGWVDQAGRSTAEAEQPGPFDDRLLAFLLTSLPAPG